MCHLWDTVQLKLDDDHWQSIKVIEEQMEKCVENDNKTIYKTQDSREYS